MSTEKEKESLLATEREKHCIGKSQSKDDTYKGARPKLKREEMKKKRMMLRKARSLSRGQLEMVAETEKSKEEEESPTQQLLPSGSELEKHEEQEEKNGCPEFFGVKSYLNSFYESVAVKDPNIYEEYTDYRYLIAPKKRKRGALCWKGSLWLGINLLVFGVVLLMVGYLIPRKEPVIGHQQEMAIIDHAALDFNRNMDFCKVVGLVVFCVGGIVLVTALLLPSLMNQYCEEELQNDSFRVAVECHESPKSPTDKKIPATEEVANIQPKRGLENEVVMTNAGLCKIP